MRDTVTVKPNDSYNEELVNNTHPDNWINPKPADNYNLVVIGGGTAGLVSAAGAAGLGAKVALIERHLMGGDCLNYGCVPSKALIRSSRIMAEFGHADSFGIVSPQNAAANFSKVMERLRKLRAGISSHDSVKRFSELGIDIFLGEGKFTGKRSIEVDGATLNFSKAVIATGAKPVIPQIDGLEEAGFHTNESIFSLTELPEKLLVIGGGPIGCELAQAFSRLGSKVTVIQRSEQFLPREDSDAAALLSKAFANEGIDVCLGAEVTQVEQSADGKKAFIKMPGGTKTVAFDQILIGAGRAPNVRGIGLKDAGVEYDSRRGVVVSDGLRTTNPRIYAAGDVCLNYKFTHTADFAARIVIQNALFKGRAKLSALTVPWCTYTDPEIAHVGMYESDAQKAGIEIESYTRDFADVDRAILDGETDGFVKVHVKKGTDTILGATIVASHAGDMISELSVAIAGGVGLKKLSSVIHPYPTQAEAIRQVGDLYNKTRLTPFVASLFKKWFSWTR